MKINEQIEFKPIDIKAHLDIAIKFRTDAFACSFINPETRWNNDKHKEYIDWLEARIHNDPCSTVHIWLHQKIIGQLELSVYKHNHALGYVNLYYLIPEMRGTSASKELHLYVVNYLRSKGHQSARLSVGKINKRAINFYLRLGWYVVGENADDAELLKMEFVLQSSL